MSFLQNREYAANQINDLSEKLERAESQLSGGGKMMGTLISGEKKKEESHLAKVTHDRFAHFFLVCSLGCNLISSSLLFDCVFDCFSSKTAIELVNGLMAQVLKDALFNQPLSGAQ